MIKVKSIRDLENFHSGESVAVLGAGPSLPGDMEKLSGNEVKIGVNAHAERITDLDYLCFADHPIKKRNVLDFQKRYIGRRVTFNTGYSDWEIDVPYFWHGRTFGLAVWFAEWIGAVSIILCGFDCYLTGLGHFHEKMKTDVNLERFIYEDLSIWREVRQSVKRPERIRSASGILIDYFGGMQ